MVVWNVYRIGNDPGGAIQEYLGSVEAGTMNNAMTLAHERWRRRPLCVIASIMRKAHTEFGIKCSAGRHWPTLSPYASEIKSALALSHAFGQLLDS